MQEALLRLSTYFDARPEGVFQQILHLLTHQYGPTMAMITIQEGERIRYRAAVNVHPALRGLDAIPLESSY
jgi:hypothetical protein